MKKIKMTIVAAAFCAAGYFSYTAYQNATMTDAERVIIANIEALTDPEYNSNPDSYSECLLKGGNWNMASVCVESGFESTTCTISGEITILGITLKGSYQKGTDYRIAWARYECKESAENCCIKQGLYSGDEKLA